MKYHLRFDDSKPQVIFITPTAAIIADPEFEGMRANAMRPFLQEHGRVFPKGEPAEWKPRYDPQVRCYNNALNAAVAYNLIYCEGLLRFTLSDGNVFEMPHGWCCTPEGEVVDPTSYRTQYLTQVEYWGVPIQTGYVVSWANALGFVGVLDGNPDDIPMGIHYDPPHLWLRRIECKTSNK